ncbi:protein NKG7-like [Branchiostoma floridae]|uniref:Protein NKG7-like n=1 Tax=Branchiostoma floridae TaxID=7739 RepID=A0A9J7M3D2_BRAFL|nr:protein NKG7-like [Branchiostoma floridae]
MTPLPDRGIISSLIGIVMYVVGIATPAWLKAGQEGFAIEVGLWQACVTHAGARTCGISQGSGVVHATRTFAVIGLLMLIAGVALAYYAAYKNPNKDKRKYGALIIAGGVCGIIAVAIFGASMRNGSGTELPIPFGYSFYLTWVQAFLTVFGGTDIIDIKAGRRDTEDDQPLHREEVIAMRESII